MSLILGSADYTDKDFDALRVRLQSLVRSVFTKWTDFNVANFANILLELYAFVGDVLTFYQDNQAAEAFIPTVTQRKNALALAKLLNYTPASASAATATERFTLGAVPVADVTFPAGTKVKTASVTEPVSFQLLTALTIAAGTDPPTGTVVVENSETYIETFAATGLAGQEHAVVRTPYIDDTMQVAAGDGAYTEVENFLQSSSTDRHFTLVVDQDDRATVRFGDGTNGKLPTGTIAVLYRVGGGAAGKVDAGSLVKIDGNFTDALGNPVTVAVTNELPSSSGDDRETVAAMRVLAPASLRTLTRTVAREDYEINAVRVPGVARALMLASDQYVGIAENTGFLYIIPDGGGVPTQTLKDAVLTMVTETYPNTITFYVEVRNPSYLTVNISAVVYLKSTATKATVKAAILQAYEDWFALTNADGSPNENVDFGYNMKDEDGAPAGELAWSDMLNVLLDVAGVRKVDDGPNGFLLNGESEDLAILPPKFPILGTVTLTDGDTGEPL